jgi:phage gpG-like protein
MPVEATIDLKDFEDGLFGLSRAATAQKKEFWKEAKPVLKRDLAEHGKLREGPAGSWPGASQATKEALARQRDKGGRFKAGGREGKSRGPRKSAGNLGKLTRAWKSFQNADGITLRNMVAWASVHNDGGRAGKANIPKRQFAWFSKDVEADITERWASHVAEGWDKSK